MLKRLVLILSFLSLPVFAGTFEDAMKTNNYVFLYLYTSDCGYCKRFLPIYEKLAKTETGVKFVKVDEIGNKMYLEMQRWAIEQALAH